MKHLITLNVDEKTSRALTDNSDVMESLLTAFSSSRGMSSPSNFCLFYEDRLSECNEQYSKRVSWKDTDEKDF